MVEHSKNESSIISEIKSNCKYSSEFFTNKSFATKELESAGIEVDTSSLDEAFEGFRLIKESLSHIADKENLKGSKEIFSRIRFELV